MRVWINGALLPDAAEAALSVTDQGFTVGNGVFEAVKVIDGTPFALTRHLTRLADGAHALGLPEVDPLVVRDGIRAVLAGTSWPLGRLRLTWSAGPGAMGVGASDGTPTLVVAYGALPPVAATAATVALPWVRNERSPVAGIKTISFAENVRGLAHAVARGAHEGIFANTSGDLCEGTMTNVFYVRDGEVFTPTLASGCLPGITRALILDWADVREVDAPLGVLDEADEIFLTSTTRDVQGVHRWGDRVLEAPGPLTRAVAEIWARRAGEDLDP